MAAKKPSAKATQAKKSAAKKTVAKKPEPAKKAAPAKKPSAPAARKPAPAPVAAKAAPKAPPKAPQTIAVTPPKSTAPKSVKAPAPAQEVAKAVPRVAIPQPPKTPIPARNLAAARGSDADNASGDNEDGDGPDTSSLNLLAGPRNVKPYIPRRGEQYMNKEQLDHFRNILGTWKRDLMQEVDRTVLHMKDEAANFPDPNDRATQESEFSLELRTRDRERKLIRKIEEAIKRIDDGSYGYCVETGEEIGIKRLEARPVATLCVEAQERRERREKQYGDRDDRYR